MAGPSPWVIVAGGFHDRGGMDRANAALASYLAGHDVPVHLVGHDIDASLSTHRLVTAHGVTRPKGMPGVAESLLGSAGVRVARTVVARSPHARVVVNGGNCLWPDINWVHAVHAAWPVHDAAAPWWARYRHRRLKTLAVKRERAALRSASLVIANSKATRRAIVERIAIDPSRIETIYLGSDPAWGIPDGAERSAAREWLQLPADVPVVVFAGALGTDTNKGFDVLWDAWKQLASSGEWDARLIVLGAGWRVDGWRREAAASRLDRSVRFLGFTSRVRDVLAAADLLVSPVRYEAYGLNVHEALCRGLAAMVTETAGVAEMFDAGMADAMLPRDVTGSILADRLRAWRGDVHGWRARASAAGARLRSRSWTDMAAEIIAVASRFERRRSA